MTIYIYPTTTTNVSDSFQDHVNRGSVNYGTDYTCSYGAQVVSVATGTVTDADGSNGGGGGRTVHVDHDDGSGADYLHMSVVNVSAGQRVGQGQRLGASGASGYGEDWYYGPHLHISFRYNHAHGYGNNGNVDFDQIMRTQGSTGGGDELSQAEVDAINQNTSNQIDRALVGVRREGRARLYFDAGPTGLEFTADTATRAVAANVTHGYLYVLNPDPAARSGQIYSLRTTPYLLIDKDEQWNPLPSANFDNMLEMANIQLRRIAQEALRQASGDPTPAATSALPFGSSGANPVLGGSPPPPAQHAVTSTRRVGWARVAGLFVVAIILLVLAAYAPVLFPTAEHPTGIVLLALGAAAAVLGGFSIPGVVGGFSVRPTDTDRAPTHRSRSDQ